MNKLLKMKADEIRQVLAGTKTAALVEINNIAMSEGKFYFINGPVIGDEVGHDEKTLAAILSGGAKVGSLLKVIESYKQSESDLYYYARNESTKDTKGTSISFGSIPLVNAIMVVEVTGIKFVNVESITKEELIKLGHRPIRDAKVEYERYLTLSMRKNLDTSLANEIIDGVDLGKVYLYVEFKLAIADSRNESVVKMAQMRIE